MKLRRLFLSLLLIVFSFASSQELPDVVMVGKTDHKYLKEQKDSYFFDGTSIMGITYTPSEKFINTDYNRFCLPTTKLFTCFSTSICCFGCSYPFLTSKDDEMMIFSGFYFDDSIEKQEEQIKFV